MSFGFDDVVFEGNVSVVGGVLVNGAVVPVGKVAAWDGENSGYYYQFVVELWLYNATSRKKSTSVELLGDILGPFNE